MAIKRGHRFTAGSREVFPQGLILMGPVQPDVEFNQDRNAPKKQRTDVDFEGVPITGLRRWKILVTDPDAERARGAAFDVILLSDHQPVPPVSAEELVPGSGLRLVHLEGLMVEARVADAKKDQYSYLNWAYWATGFEGDTNTPKASGSGHAKAGA